MKHFADYAMPVASEKVTICHGRYITQETQTGTSFTFTNLQ